MRWTSKPMWAPILLIALAGALAVPFVPFANLILRRILVFIPTPMFYISGTAMGVLVGLITWRLFFAGFVQCTRRGLRIRRYQPDLLLPWTELDTVDEDGVKGDRKARFTMRDGTQHIVSYVRFPREDAHRMRRLIVDPILILPVNERLAAVEQILEKKSRDELILTILQVYAVLLGGVAVVLSWVL